MDRSSELMRRVSVAPIDMGQVKKRLLAKFPDIVGDCLSVLSNKDFCRKQGTRSNEAKTIAEQVSKALVDQNEQHERAIAQESARDVIEEAKKRFVETMVSEWEKREWQFVDGIEHYYPKTDWPQLHPFTKMRFLRVHPVNLRDIVEKALQATADHILKKLARQKGEKKPSIERIVAYVLRLLYQLLHKKEIFYTLPSLLLDGCRWSTPCVLLSRPKKTARINGGVYAKIYH